jgi:hypothetical protein
MSSVGGTCKAEHFRSLEVGREFKSGCQQKRQLGGLCALKHFCGVDACLPVGVGMTCGKRPKTTISL